MCRRAVQPQNWYLQEQCVKQEGAVGCAGVYNLALPDLLPGRPQFTLTVWKQEGSARTAFRTGPPSPLVPLATGRIPVGPGRVRSRTNAPGAPQGSGRRGGGEGVVHPAGLRAALWACAVGRAGLDPRRPRTCLPGDAATGGERGAAAVRTAVSERARVTDAAAPAGNGRPLGCERRGAWRGRGGQEAAGAAARDAPALAHAGAGAAAGRGSMLGSAARPR